MKKLKIQEIYKGFFPIGRFELKYDIFSLTNQP